MNPTAFEFILQYCYGVDSTEMLKIDKTNVIAIYYAASKYLIAQISDSCVNFMETKTNEQNILPIFYDAMKYGLQDIESKLFQILKGKAHLVIDDDMVIRLPYKWFSELFVKNDESVIRCL